MLLYLTGLICSLICGSFANVITPVQDEVYKKDGENVTLSCSYSSASTLQWYRQYPGSAPEFLVLILHSTGMVSQKSEIVERDPRLSGKVNEKKTRVDLEIFSTTVTDSAIYYCALTPTKVSKCSVNKLKNIYCCLSLQHQVLSVKTGFDQATRGPVLPIQKEIL
ncbi:hypothetical protein QQF64_015170 [Cirrhinus molitorella]|uniref:Ig-like domain-containing protein n=1 Tax=Cirrhinus molitorella TaxID=172907 RepID=A0ABR3NVL5_9TELE